MEMLGLEFYEYTILPFRSLGVEELKNTLMVMHKVRSPTKSFFKRFYRFIFRGRKREGGREKEKHQYERETSIDCLLQASHLGTEPITQTYALARN